MATLWLRYPNENEPLQKQFYDCFTEDDQLIRRVWPNGSGSFQRAGVFVRGVQVVAIRIADDLALTASTCRSTPRIPALLAQGGDEGPRPRYSYKQARKTERAYNRVVRYYQRQNRRDNRELQRDRKAQAKRLKKDHP